MILSNGQIEVYDGATMAPLDTLNTQAINANGAAIADVDNDGEMEFAIAGGNYLHIYNARTLLPEWSTASFSGSDVEVGDFDDDGKNEIILPGGILDGATHEVEWIYVGGFGSNIELANIDQDAALEIIGISSNNFITAFDGQLHSPLWQINTNANNQGLYVTDLEADGKSEILAGNNQSGSVNCYSATTQQKLWEITTSSYGATNLCVGDPDGDGVKEVVWGAGQYYSGLSSLFIGSTKLRTIEWTSLDLTGPFAVDVFDVDDDGTREIVGASRRSSSVYGAGTVLIHDGLLHNLEWLSGNSVNNEIRCGAAGNINDNEHGEIVAGVGDKIYILDGITHQKTWESPALGPVNAIALADIDNDQR